MENPSWFYHFTKHNQLFSSSLLSVFLDKNMSKAREKSFRLSHGTPISVEGAKTGGVTWIDIRRTDEQNFSSRAEGGPSLGSGRPIS